MKNLILETNVLERALLTLDNELAESIVRNSISKGSPIEIASELVSQTLQRIGNSWEEGKLALSQVYMSGIICEEIINKILELAIFFPPLRFGQKLPCGFLQGSPSETLPKEQKGKR
jgi:hypothetical protein